MHAAPFVHWQDGPHWLGYWEAFPDHLTQGESYPDLLDHLADLYAVLSSGTLNA